METARYDVGIRELEQPERLGLVRDAFFAPQRFRERLRSVDAVTRETASLFQSSWWTWRRIMRTRSAWHVT